ncbi:SKP1-like protein 5 [Drosophila busckii]|uniref:SKP1-like protein 5 n=1 Tax=Drosophila busckii TaxID=30019 RepID=UPI00083F15E4|nr:SKP1-like protein 5 [Drosophila busckii]
MSQSPQKLQVLTSDGKLFDVSAEVSKEIGLTQSWLQQDTGDYISHLAGDEDCAEPDDPNVLPLDRISAHIFGIIVKWCEIVAANRHVDYTENCELLQHLLNEAHALDSTLFDVIVAADFLNIDSLLQASTKLVADAINACNSVEAIRERFNIPMPDEAEIE